MDKQRLEGIAGISASRPACDNCKVRKTKCDRGNPCSVCVTANLVCEFSRRRPEKRQRVFLSAKYEDALQSVDERLTEISESLQNVAARQELLPIRGFDLSLSVSNKTHSSLFLETITGSRDFKGYSSFYAHVNDLERLVQSACLDSGTEVDTGYNWTSTQGSPDDDLDVENDEPLEDSLQTKYPELASRIVPPLEITYRLLRLVYREPQRLFTDVPVLDVDELGSTCQKVYLSQKEVSVFDWITLNVSLHQIFTDLDRKHYLELGLVEDQVDTIIENLESNCKAAIESLRLCVYPSIKACRATALLSSYCVRSGHHHTAYRLTTFAARLMLEMGLHRSPLDFTNQKSALFWHVYSYDKFLSFTSGRTATIHHYDVTTERQFTFEKHHLIVSGLGPAFIDFAHLAGQIHLQLFSASAKEAPPSTRIEHANSVIAQVRSQLEALQRLSHSEDPTSKTVYECLSLVGYCYLTIVYNCVSSDQGGLQPCQDLVDNARTALEILLELGHRKHSRDPEAWFKVLNVCLAFTPLVPIIILARYTITNPSHNHLDLLKPVLNLIECAGTTSPAIQELRTASTRLCRAAESAVARRSVYVIDKEAST